MSKKMIVLSIFLVMVIVIILFLSKTTKKGGFPVPIFNSPTPTPSSTSLTPTLTAEEAIKQQQNELQGEINYAKERQQYLEKNPWVLKMPLQSDYYFISYDPDKNQFLATIYIYSSSLQTKEQQIENAKKLSLEALKAVGAVVKPEDVVFIEVQK